MLTSPNNQIENWAIDPDKHDSIQHSIDKGREDAICGRAFFPKGNDPAYNSSYEAWKNHVDNEKKKADDWDRSHAKDDPTILGYLALFAISFIGYATTSLYCYEHPFIAGLVAVLSILMGMMSIICLVIELIGKSK